MTNKKENRASEIFLEKWHPFFWIAIVVFAVYSATLFYNIVYLDDNVLVVGQYQFNSNLSNAFVAFGEDIFRSPSGTGSFYRPIERLTFIFDAQFGEKAIIFMSHLSNLFLHIASICLLFVLLLKLNIKKEAAFLFSLIFGVHPLTAQTVAFISGRNDSLLAIFVFPALIFFWKYLETQERKYYFWHLAFFAMALFTKETAAVVPLICAAYILIFINIKQIKDNHKPCLHLLAGWGVVSLLWLLIRRAVLNNLIGNADYHVIPSIIYNFPALLPTVGKIILPFDLSVFPVLKDMTMVWGIISLLILGAWFALSKKRNYRFIIFGVVWFFLFILLTLIKPMDSTPEFSENRIYIPMFGFIFIFLGLGKVRFLDVFNEKLQKKILITLGIIIIIIFSSVTIYRNRYYKDKLSFWKNAVETSPSFAFNHNNLGAMYYLDNNFDSAEAEFDKALVLNPNEKLAHNNLGLIYMDRGEYDQAEEEFNAELAINPYYDNAYANKALLYYKTGKMDEAVDMWKKTLEVNPAYSEALYNLFSYYYQKQDQQDATYWAEQTQARGMPILPEMQNFLNPAASSSNLIPLNK